MALRLAYKISRTVTKSTIFCPPNMALRSYSPSFKNFENDNAPKSRRGNRETRARSRPQDRRTPALKRPRRIKSAQEYRIKKYYLRDSRPVTKKVVLDVIKRVGKGPQTPSHLQPYKFSEYSVSEKEKSLIRAKKGKPIEYPPVTDDPKVFKKLKFKSHREETVPDEKSVLSIQNKDECEIEDEDENITPLFDQNLYNPKIIPLSCEGLTARSEDGRELTKYIISTKRQEIPLSQMKRLEMPFEIGEEKLKDVGVEISRDSSTTKKSSSPPSKKRDSPLNIALKKLNKPNHPQQEVVVSKIPLPVKKSKNKDIMPLDLIRQITVTEKISTAPKIESSQSEGDTLSNIQVEGEKLKIRRKEREMPHSLVKREKSSKDSKTEMDDQETHVGDTATAKSMNTSRIPRVASKSKKDPVEVNFEKYLSRQKKRLSMKAKNFQQSSYLTPIQWVAKSKGGDWGEKIKERSVEDQHVNVTLPAAKEKPKDFSAEFRHRVKPKTLRDYDAVLDEIEKTRSAFKAQEKHAKSKLNSFVESNQKNTKK